MTSSISAMAVGLRLGGAGLDGGAAGQPPPRPRPVKDRRAGMADQMSGERDRTGRHAGAAARHDRTVERDAGLVKESPEFIGAPKLLCRAIGDKIEGQVAAPGDVAAATPRPKLVGGALEPAGGAGIDDLFAASLDIGPDRLLAADQ